MKTDIEVIVGSRCMTRVAVEFLFLIRDYLLDMDISEVSRTLNVFRVHHHLYLLYIAT